MIILYLLGGYLSGIFVIMMYLVLIDLTFFSKKEILFSSLVVFASLFISGFSPLPQTQYVLICAIFLVIGLIKLKEEPLNLILFLALFSVLLSSFINYIEHATINIILRSFSSQELITSLLNILFLLMNIAVINLIPSDRINQIYLFFKNNKYLNHFMVVSLLLLVLFSELTSGLTTNSFIRLLFVNNREIMYLFLSVGIFTLLLLIELGIHSNENTEHTVLMNNLSDYNNEIERLNEELSMFRHDYLNILHTLKISIDNKNIDEIAQIYQHVLFPTEKYIKSTQKQTATLYRIKNIELKSLISYKINHARQLEINCNMYISNVIYFNQEFELVILVRILSILIDNAIENTIRSEEPGIKLTIFKQAGHVKFIIENSYPIKDFSLDMFRKKRFTSKKDKNAHGLGLNYVNQVAKSSKTFDIETTVDHVYFKQELTVLC